MDEQTTTDATTQDTGAETTAQPEEQHAEAVTTTEGEPTQTNTVSEETTEQPTEADAVVTWMQKKGIDPTDPEALSKLANMAQNAEKQMHKATVDASALKKQLEQSPGGELDTDNELVKELYGEVTAVKRAQAIDSFKQEVGLTAEQEKQMVGYLSENPTIGQLVNMGHLSLPQLYAMSVGSQIDTAKLKQDGGRDALQQLKNKQMSGALPGNSTTSAMSPPQTDAFRAALLGKS